MTELKHFNIFPNYLYFSANCPFLYLLLLLLNCRYVCVCLHQLAKVLHTAHFFDWDKNCKDFSSTYLLLFNFAYGRFVMQKYWFLLHGSEKSRNPLENRNWMVSNKIRGNHSEKPEKSCFGGGNGSSTDPSSESMDLRNGGVALGSTMRIFNLKQQGWWNPPSAPLVLSRGYQWHCPQDKAVPGHWGRRGRLMSRQQVTPGQTWRPHSKRYACRGPPTILWAWGEAGAHSHPQNLHLKDQHGSQARGGEGSQESGGTWGKPVP